MSSFDHDTVATATMQRRRCPLCGNAEWDDDSGGARCNHCRLVVRDIDALDEARTAIPHRLANVGAHGFAADRWSLDAIGWRHAAWRYGFVLHDAIARRAVSTAHSITLGMIARGDDPDGVVALVDAIGQSFLRVIVVLDGSADDARRLRDRLPNATVEPRMLAGDFAAQRNRVQELAGGGWVVQLDTDERADGDMLANLGWLVAAADREGLRSLGFPRRNLVDGVMSAQYPDIQYRLNRADIRFAKPVHERPVVAYEDSSLALCCAIEHHLSANRARARTRLYEGMAAGSGRPEDEERLLRPFDPIADR